MLAKLPDNIVPLKVLFIGDIVGELGREAVRQLLPDLKSKHQADLVIANAENVSHGNGLTKKHYFDLVTSLGIDFLTGGNHIWDKKDIFKDIRSFTKLVRPANFPPGVPGLEKLIVEVKGLKIGIFNLLGRVFMQSYDDPFRAADRMVDELRKDDVDITLVDIHAEATSEKVALGWYLDGRVSAIIGTHTHVQTADEKILPKGTAYITDVGFTGGSNSVIGVEIAPVLRRFQTQISAKFDPPSTGPMQFNAVVVEIGDDGKAINIERILERI